MYIELFISHPLCLATLPYFVEAFAGYSRLLALGNKALEPKNGLENVNSGAIIYSDVSAVIKNLNVRHHGVEKC